MDSSYSFDGIKQQHIEPSDSISQFRDDKSIQPLTDTVTNAPHIKNKASDGSVTLEHLGLKSTNILFIKNNDQKYINLVIAREILTVKCFFV